MQRVMNYMKERELRPTELFRSFDKAVKSKLTKRQFANRIQVNSRKLRYNTSGGSRGRSSRRSFQSNPLHFHAVFGKNYANKNAFQ